MQRAMAEQQRTIPNFAVFTDAELYGFTQSDHELAGVAKHIYDCQKAIKRIVGAEFIVRDLAKASAVDFEKLRTRAEVYVRDVIEAAARGVRSS
jgi:hypothetical protein